jgi:hypothetical protein
MHPKWIAGYAILVICGAILNEIIVGSWGMSYELSLFNDIIKSWQYISSGNIGTAIYGIVSMPLAVIVAVGRIIFWDFAFFHGSWVVAQYMIWTAIGVAILVSLLLALRGTPSG